MPAYFGSDELSGEALGDDEIFGDDSVDGEAMGYDEIFGGPPKKKTSMSRRVAMARAAGGVYTGKTEPTTMREQPLPFSRSYTTGEQFTISLQPQRMFRPERLVFASVTATFFTISDVSIAQEPQFVAPGSTLAQLFSEVSVGMRLRGKTANLGALVSINATNIDTTTRVLYGTIIGTVVM